MSRVNESREAQRLLEQRRHEEQNKDQAKSKNADFSRVMTQRQDNTARANQKAQADSGRLAGQQSEAGSALLARQGIQANRFAAQLQQQGKQSLTQGKSQSKSRRAESEETHRSAGHREAAADDKRVMKQADKLQAISRDDHQQQDRGGDLGGGREGERGDKGGKEGREAQAAQPGQLAQAQGPQQAAPTQQAQAVAAPRLPPEVINQIVERVLVGVNKQGLSEFHIEFKGNLLAGTSVHVTAQDGKISARFESPDANVRRLVKSSEGELARAFARKGLKLERLEVNGP